jgi:hypothetical protein
MSGNYDPNLKILRELLALSIINRLDEAGFTESGFDDKTKEKVYSRNISGTNIDVKVYTTVVGMEVRGSGKDAIRVCATYKTKSGSQKGIVKSSRVNRHGNIEDIVERMISRMRKTWRSAQTGKKCLKCGAPTFVAKSGKDTCAEICWLTEDQKNAQRLNYKFKSSARRHRSRYQ